VSELRDIRAAAALMRERALAATGSPWVADDTEIYSEVQGGSWVAETLQLDDATAGAANGEHIASWDPAVAEAVADLLDGLVSFYISYGIEPTEPVLAVVRAYLRTPAVTA